MSSTHTVRPNRENNPRSLESDTRPRLVPPHEPKVKLGGVREHAWLGRGGGRTGSSVRGCSDFQVLDCVDALTECHFRTRPAADGVLLTAQDDGFAFRNLRKVTSIDTLKQLVDDGLDPSTPAFYAAAVLPGHPDIRNKETRVQLVADRNRLDTEGVGHVGWMDTCLAYGKQGASSNVVIPMVRTLDLGGLSHVRRWHGAHVACGGNAGAPADQGQGGAPSDQQRGPLGSSRRR